MKIVIKKKFFDQLSESVQAEFAPFDLSTEDFVGYRDEARIDLTEHKVDKLRRFAEVMADVKGTQARQAVRISRSVSSWIDVLTNGPSSAKIRDAEIFTMALTRFMVELPNRWLFREYGDRRYPLLITSIAYDHGDQGKGRDRKPQTVVSYSWIECAEYHTGNMHFSNDLIQGRTIVEILKASRVYPETEDLRAEYAESMEWFKKFDGQIGLQVTATGEGLINFDGRSWNSYEIEIGNEHTPARGVIDIFGDIDEVKEDDRRLSSARTGLRGTPPSFEFWNSKALDETATDDEDDATDDRRLKFKIPTHPTLVIYDLKKHSRIRLDADQLKIYEYDTTLAQKLVLPTDTVDLIDMLVNGKLDYQDIVSDKGSGRLITCAGPAGVGKTLTAEVFSEASKRPLYSVQCAQLGVDPETLEKSLHVVFKRAKRWNAILLLDEADVYVMARGDDLIQNAIVGVFLRTLEYFSGLVFLTTNRGDVIDDAIASRCIAKIDYQLPTIGEQKRIWRILADTASIKISDETIEQISALHPALSGRDVKNMIKLGSMHATTRGVELGLDSLNFAKRFKPTADIKYGKTRSKAGEQ
jgi:hypothetical protein